MSFGDLTPLPADPLLALSGRFRADPRPRKIDLGVGVYRDPQGRTPVFGAVKTAEHELAGSQPSKAYLGSEGNLDFVRVLAAEALGWHVNVTGLQTVGGTGALRLAGELLARSNPRRRLWLGLPSWPNHVPIFAASQLPVARVEMVDATARYQPEALLLALRDAAPDDAVLLHGCCHNPTGIDVDLAWWAELAELIVARKLLPVVDMAYQGLGTGWQEDSAGLRLLAARVPTLLVAYSCDKNFGLYRERVGALFVRAPGTAESAALSHLVALARADYSMPPDHGAAVVQRILENRDLTAAWQQELAGMRIRLNGLRRALAAQGRIGAVDLGALAHGTGMFALLPLSVRQIDLLQSEHGIYMAPSGRINIAGLTEQHIPVFTAALSAVQHKHAA